MRILLSWLRDFVDVGVDVAALADALVMRGFEVASIEETGDAPRPPWHDAAGARHPDAIIDLEITANRPDGLSVLGIAREVSTIYSLPLRTFGSPGSRGLDLRTLPRGDNPAIRVIL